MRILGISGSLRRGSHNRTLLRAARAELPAGVDLVEWDGLAGLPAFNEALEGRLRHRCAPFCASLPRPMRC